jgi:hypothetical protein
MNPNYYCSYCDVTCCKKSDLVRHEKTAKHLKMINYSNNDNPKFECVDCDYRCCKQSVFNKHLSTNKHKRIESTTQLDNTSAITIERETSSQNGTFLKCSEIAPVDPENARADYMTIILELMKQTNELKNFIIEQASEHKKETMEIVNKVIENTKPVINTINGNVNNQKFNINVFLNEQCKDAMNFSDFIKGIEVSREDLENNAQLGFVGGISKIFLDNLKQLSINERPIHCTDLKRETMYIKDDDKWTKETGPAKLNTVIQRISQKSTRTLLDWKKENPDYNDNDSAFSTRCIVIQRNSMAGYDRETYYPKVIRAIAKETMVDK